ncbi:GHKL domain-containing protein [Enterococcus villorum]|uniref:GHKL domain-containing protein n=1 Tax=Enterococcus villorum TaxID=112904 RepID=A0A1V8YVK5_9ENTE|nr:GHKL domain-containing protein [Enterococcus villorum]OQO71497.1 GHKL domain-containing protein [Enterococcus villorum]OQO76672.1 GHKL domain-containing protein [Enterococcus villorum]
MSLELLIIMLVQVGSITLGVGFLADLLQSKSYLFFCLTSTCVYLFLYDHIDIVASILLWSTLCLIIYFIKNNGHIAFFYPSLTLFIYIFSDSLSDYLYSVFDLSLSIFRQFAFGVCYFWIITYCIKKFLLKRIVYEEERLKIASYIFAFTTVIYFSIICADRFPILKRHIAIANELFMIIYGVMSTLIFITLLWMKKKEFETREQQKDLQHLIEHIEQIEKSYAELLKFKHDYKNILISLEDYIQTNDMGGLQTYFYKSIKATETIFDKNNLHMSSISNLKIKELKSIILSKLYVASQKGIEVRVMIPEIVTHIDLPAITLVRMLGIILDNAIEESELIDEPKIDLMILKKEKHHSIILINQCRPNMPKLHEIKQINFTTKKGNQGLGLTNLDELVRSNRNVYLETEIAEKQFTQIITVQEKRE